MLVEPKGPQPVKHVRGPSSPKVEPPLPVVEKVIEEANVYVAEHYDLDPNNPLVLMEESEFYGQFCFRDTILPQLERYMFYLDRMQRHDPESWAFYKEMGMQLLPYCTNSLIGKADPMKSKWTTEEMAKYKSKIVLPPVFNLKRPNFGCVAFGCCPKVEKWEEEANKKILYPRFLYYTKWEKQPPEVQRVPPDTGDIYQMTVWWDSIIDKRNKWGRPTEYAVFIDKAGTQIKILKLCETKMIPIKEKHSLRWFDIPARAWRMPEDYSAWSRQHGLDVQTHLSHLFCTTLRDQEQAHYGDVRVQVTKDDMSAVFNIDSRRAPYFFQDRDVTLTESGRRKKAFHITAPTVCKNGSARRMYYSGEKHFTWAGYTVDITVPGLDHFMLEDFNVGAYDSYWWTEDMGKGIGKAELGKRLHDQIKQGFGGMK